MTPEQRYEMYEGSHRRAVVNAEIVSEALQARQAVALVADRK